MASNKNNKEERATVVENLDSHLTSAGAKIANNKKIIYICVGVVAAVAAFVLSYIFIYRNPRLQNSWEAYNKVQLMKEKGGKPDKLAEEYRKVATNFSSTPAGDAAALAAAEYFYDAKNYDAAIKHLEGLGISDPVLKAQARALLGDCYVNKKQYDKALGCYDEAIKIADGNPQLVPAYMLKKAFVYAGQNKHADALKIFEEIKKNYPKFMGNEIEYYIENEKALMGK